MRTSIQIDPNVRIHGNCTYAGFEDVRWNGGLSVGDEVVVIEPEADLLGRARVTQFDAAKRLVFLSLDWADLRPRGDTVVDDVSEARRGILFVSYDASTDLDTVATNVVQLSGRSDEVHVPPTSVAVG